MKRIHELIPKEIWVHEISLYFGREDLPKLRLLSRHFEELYQMIYFSRYLPDQDNFEKNKKEFLEQRRLWKVMRDKLTEEEKSKYDEEFFDEFWQGFGSESWTGHTIVEQTKGGSAKKVSEEDCFTNPLWHALSYDCTHCNIDHHQMLRLALICEIETTPQPSLDSYRDFNCIFSNLHSRYYKNFLQNLFTGISRVKFGCVSTRSILESFILLMEYIFIANSLKEESYDFATPILYEVLGLYEKFRKGLKENIEEMNKLDINEQRNKSKKESFFENLKKLKPFHHFRRLLRLCIFYGADIYKNVSFDIHCAEYYGGDKKPSVMNYNIEDNCLSRTLKIDDPYYFLFLVTRGNFFFPNFKKIEEFDYFSIDEKIKNSEFVDRDHLFCQMMKCQLDTTSLLISLRFWKCLIAKKEDYMLFAKHYQPGILFMTVQSQQRKVLNFFLKNEEVCETILIERAVREVDGESLFSFACGRRGKMERLVELLIVKGWNVDHQNKNGETGLMKAIRIRNVDTIQVIFTSLRRRKGGKFGDHLSGIRNEKGESAKDLLSGDPWLCWKLGFDLSK